MRCVFQAADDELRTIARQDSLFRGLSLAAVDPFFFFRPSFRQLLILRRDNGWLTWPGGTVQAVDDKLGTIARQDFLLRGLLLAAGDPFPFLCSLCNQFLMLRRDSRLALAKPGNRHHEQHDQRGRAARDEHAHSFQFAVMALEGQEFDAGMVQSSA